MHMLLRAMDFSGNLHTFLFTHYPVEKPIPNERIYGEITSNLLWLIRDQLRDDAQ
jgi:hypothetical protein